MNKAYLIKDIAGCRPSTCVLEPSFEEEIDESNFLKWINMRNMSKNRLNLILSNKSQFNSTPVLEWNENKNGMILIWFVYLQNSANKFNVMGAYVKLTFDNTTKGDNLFNFVPVMPKGAKYHVFEKMKKVGLSSIWFLIHNQP